jgi:hypothetical protein
MRKLRRYSRRRAQFHKILSPQANQANGVIKITDDPIKVRQIENLIR